MTDDRETALTRRDALTTLSLSGATLLAGCAAAQRVAAPAAQPRRTPEIPP